MPNNAPRITQKAVGLESQIGPWLALKPTSSLLAKLPEPKASNLPSLMKPPRETVDRLQSVWKTRRRRSSPSGGGGGIKATTSARHCRRGRRKFFLDIPFL